MPIIATVFFSLVALLLFISTSNASSPTPANVATTTVMISPARTASPRQKGRDNSILAVATGTSKSGRRSDTLHTHDNNNSTTTTHRSSSGSQVLSIAGPTSKLVDDGGNKEVHLVLSQKKKVFSPVDVANTTSNSATRRGGSQSIRTSTGQYYARWHQEHGGDLLAGRYAFSTPQRRYGASLVAVDGVAGVEEGRTVLDWDMRQQMPLDRLDGKLGSGREGLASSSDRDSSVALVLLYGYNYDHARQRPVWLDDVWAFHPSPPYSRLNSPLTTGTTSPPLLQFHPSPVRVGSNAAKQEEKERKSSSNGGKSIRTNDANSTKRLRKTARRSSHHVGSRPPTRAVLAPQAALALPIRSPRPPKFREGWWRRKITSGPAPPPSYKHMMVGLHELILVFGGDDGGLRKSGRSGGGGSGRIGAAEGGGRQPSYHMGSFYQDLYVLSVNSWRWRRVPQLNAPSPRQGGTLSVVVASDGEEHEEKKKGRRASGDAKASSGGVADGEPVDSRLSLVVLFGGMVHASTAAEEIVVEATQKRGKTAAEGDAIPVNPEGAASNQKLAVLKGKMRRSISSDTSELIESNSVYVLPASDLQGRPKRVAWHRCVPADELLNSNINDKEARVANKKERDNTIDKQEFAYSSSSYSSSSLADHDELFGRTWPTPRRGHSATTGPDGSLYIFGGFASVSSTSSSRKRVQSAKMRKNKDRMDAGGNEAIRNTSSMGSTWASTSTASPPPLSPTVNLNDLWRLRVVPHDGNGLLSESYVCHWERLWPPLTPPFSSKGEQKNRTVSNENNEKGELSHSNSFSNNSYRGSDHEDDDAAAEVLAPSGRGGHAMAAIRLPITYRSATEPKKKLGEVSKKTLFAEIVGKDSSKKLPSVSVLSSNAESHAEEEEEESVVFTTQIVITNGAHCTIGCKCLSDTWRFTIQEDHTSGGLRKITKKGTAEQPTLSSSLLRWEQLSTPDEATPSARYSMGYATVRDRLFMFGGEGYKPYAYWNDMWSIEVGAVGGVEKRESSSGTTEKEQEVSRASFPSFAEYYTVKSTENMTHLMLRTRDEEEMKPHDRERYYHINHRIHSKSARASSSQSQSQSWLGWMISLFTGTSSSSSSGANNVSSKSLLKKGTSGKGHEQLKKQTNAEEALEEEKAEEDLFYSDGRLACRRGMLTTNTKQNDDHFNYYGGDEGKEENDQKQGQPKHSSPLRSRLYRFSELDFAVRQRLLYGDSDPLLPSSVFGGYESIELSFPVVTFFFILPLAMGFSAVVGFYVVARRRMRLWRKQNK